MIMLYLNAIPQKQSRTSWKVVGLIRIEIPQGMPVHVGHTYILSLYYPQTNERVTERFGERT